MSLQDITAKWLRQTGDATNGNGQVQVQRSGPLADSVLWSFEVQSQSVYFEKHIITKNPQKYDLSAIHVIKRSIYTLATLDYGQRWLVLNPLLNNKHQVIKIHMLDKLCDLKFKNKIN